MVRSRRAVESLRTAPLPPVDDGAGEEAVGDVDERPAEILLSNSLTSGLPGFASRSTRR